jgi:hypothetical protein
MSFTLVIRGFSLCCFASGDDANDISVLSLAVAYQEEPGIRTHAQEKKPVFINRVLFIEELNGEIVIEDSLGHLEGNLVLLNV